MVERKIYIDGLFYKYGGIGKYYSDLLKGFLESGILVYTAVPEKFEKDFLKEFKLKDKLEVIFVKYEKFSLRGFFEHSAILKRLENKIDAFIFPHVNLPLLIPRNSIVVIHDFRPFTEFWDRSILKKYALLFYYNRAIEKAMAIVAISDFTREEILRLYPDVEKKIYKIYNPFKFDLNENCSRILEEKYILYVGDRKKHKNIGNLIESFNLIKDKVPHKLLIVGKKEKSTDSLSVYLNKNSDGNKIVEMIDVDDKDLFCLYKYADLLVMPSFYEGFGRTPIEAVAHGCPAIVSDIAVFREIWGENTIYFNPKDTNDMASKIYLILSNPEFRNNLICKQKKVVSKFIQENKFLEEFLHIVEMIAANKDKM